MKNSLTTQADNKSVFILKRKRNWVNWIQVIFNGIWVVGCFAFIPIFVVGLIEDKSKRNDDEIYFILLFIFVAGLWVLKIFLYQLRGKEQITIDENNLTIERLGTFLTIPKMYETSLVDNLRFGEFQTAPWWYHFIGLRGGEINFDYLGQKKYFGQTLSESEANEIISQLQEHLNRVRNKLGVQ